MEPIKVWSIDEDLFLEAMNTGKLSSDPSIIAKLEQQTKERRLNAN